MVAWSHGGSSLTHLVRLGTRLKKPHIRVLLRQRPALRLAHLPHILRHIALVADQHLIYVVGTGEVRVRVRVRVRVQVRVQVRVRVRVRVGVPLTLFTFSAAWSSICLIQFFTFCVRVAVVVVGCRAGGQLGS